MTDNLIVSLKHIFALSILLFVTMPIFGHGVRINHTIDETSGEITVVAAFDTGEPLAEAQIIIFAPNDLVNPWLTDTTDEDGAYTFTPDYEIEGFWDVQVRQAGHGGLVNIELTSDMAPSEEAALASDTNSSQAVPMTISDTSAFVISGDAQFQVEGNIVISATGNITQAEDATTITDDVLGNGFTTGQIVIMAASVIWGFIGTALYFSRRSSQ